MFTPLRTMLGEPEGRVLAASALTALTVGTAVYTILEGWSPLDSLYFSVVSLATVGFGDLHPTTDVAKLFTIGYIFTRIGILAGFGAGALLGGPGSGGCAVRRAAMVATSLVDI